MTVADVFITLQPPAPSQSNTVVPFPLTPSWIWDDAPNVIVWTDISVMSKFYAGAVQLGLRRKRRQDGKWMVKTTQEELAMLIIWSWGQ